MRDRWYLGIQSFCFGRPAILFDSLCGQVDHCLVEVAAYDGHFVFAETGLFQHASRDDAGPTGDVKDYGIGWLGG